MKDSRKMEDKTTEEQKQINTFTLVKFPPLFSSAMLYLSLNAYRTVY